MGLRINFRRFSRLWGAFQKDADGGITVVTLSTFVVMVVSIGMAIDFMWLEVKRVRLQDALDRGVLAAAGEANPDKAFDIVHDYLSISQFDPDDAQMQFKTRFVKENRQVASEAIAGIDTIFLKMIGIPQLKAQARSAASLALGTIEVSLVLDISGSMTSSRSANGFIQSTLARLGIKPALPNRTTRLDYMKSAAVVFVDLLFDSGWEENTTVNLIPFSGQVNPGNVVADYMLADRTHDNSSCIEFSHSDYEQTLLPSSTSAEQVPHFRWYDLPGHLSSILKWGWCPSDNNAIEYFSNDRERLKERIKNLEAFDGTGTQNAMKWAVGLLDPANQPITDQLVLANEINPNFADRPLSSDNTGGIKVIVFLSDGGTTFQPRPKDSEYDSPEDHQRWAGNTLGQASGNRPGTGPSKMLHTEDESRANFQKACELAENLGAFVFTIGYDMSADSQPSKDLRDCATNPLMHRAVDREELNKAFLEIVNSITKLRLDY